MHATTVRRHHDGSIDYDFYRARAKALHAQAMRDFFAKRSLSKMAVIAAATLIAAAAIVIAPGRSKNVSNDIGESLEALSEIR